MSDSVALTPAQNGEGDPCDVMGTFDEPLVQTLCGRKCAYLRNGPKEVAKRWVRSDGAWQTRAVPLWGTRVFFVFAPPSGDINAM